MVQTRSHTEGAVFAVHVGRQRGIFTTWAEALKHVKDYQGTIYKKLSSRAEAERWLNDYAARDAAELSARANKPGVSGKGAGHQQNALGLVIEPSASRERVTSAPAQDGSMDVDDSDDDAYAEVRAAEEVLRRARAKMAAKSKAKAGAAAVSEWEATMQPEASASIKREKDARVKKEEEIVVDVQTWSQVKAEKETRKDERRYTASEKGKGRATTSRRPVETTATAPSTRVPAEMQRPTNETSVAAIQADQKPTPVPATEAAASRKASVPQKQTQVTSPRPALDEKSALPTTKAPAAANVASSTRSVVNGQTRMAEPDPYILAYTDGSAKNNQSPLRIGGYGVHWGAGRPAGVAGDISIRCVQGKTNNYAELVAIIRVLELTMSDPRPLTIVTDSMYSKNCFDWWKGWRDRGWKKSGPAGGVPENLDLVRYMVALRTLRAGSTIVQHEKAHTGDKKGAILTPHQRGNKIADSLANAASELPEEAAEKVSDEDWAKARASAEKRVEELNRKKESEAVHIDVGSAMGYTQHPPPDVGGTSQAMTQMAITVKKPEIATKAGGSGTPRGGKLSRDAIKAVLSRSPIPDTTAPSSSATAAKSPTSASAEPHGQTPTPASSQSISQSTPTRAPAASTSAAAAPSTQTSTAPAPQTPSRSTARTNGHASSQAARAHTTPVATGPGKEPDGKVIVRLVDEEKEPYDEGIWDEEDTLDDADMFAEAMGP